MPRCRPDYKAHQSHYMTPETRTPAVRRAALGNDRRTGNRQRRRSARRLRQAPQPARGAGEAPRPAHSGRRQGRRQRTLALAQQVLAQAKAGKTSARLPSSTHRIRPPRATAAIWAGPTAATTSSRLRTRCSAWRSARSATPSRRSSATTSSSSMRSRPARGKSFEEARAEIEAQLRKDAQATDHFGDIQEQLQSKLQDPNADRSRARSAVPHADRGCQASPRAPEHRRSVWRVRCAVFADPPLGVGKLGGPVLVGDDRLVIAKVLEHRKPEPRPVSEVREGIVTHGSPRIRARRRRWRPRRPRAASAGRRVDRGRGSGAEGQRGTRSLHRPHRSFGPGAGTRRGLRTAGAGRRKPAFSALALNTGGAAVLAVSAVRTGAVHRRQGAPRGTPGSRAPRQRCGGGLRRGSAPRRKRQEESRTPSTSVAR